LVQAKEFYVRIGREELRSNAPKAFGEAQKAAATELAALEPRIALLTIVVKGQAAPEATVTMDGVEIPRALVGVGYPTNPGSHTLRASGPGSVAPDVTVQLAEGAKETATLELVDKPKTATTVEPTVVKPTPSGLRRAAPWIAFGVGAVGLG